MEMTCLWVRRMDSEAAAGEQHEVGGELQMMQGGGCRGRKQILRCLEAALGAAEADNKVKAASTAATAELEAPLCGILGVAAAAAAKSAAAAVATNSHLHNRMRVSSMRVTWPLPARPAECRLCCCCHARRKAEGCIRALLGPTCCMAV